MAVADVQLFEKLERPSTAATPVVSHAYRSITAAILVSIAALSVIGIGAIGALGNALANERLLSVLPGLSAMKFNTALCLIAGGVALWSLMARDLSTKFKPITLACAAFAFLVGSATCVEYVFGIDLGIDELLMADPTNEGLAGRMGFNTAICFVLANAALLILAPRSLRPTQRMTAEVLAFLSGLIAVFTLIGYAFSATALTRIASYTPMALHTALALAFLAIGTLCLPRPRNSGILDAINLTRRATLPAFLLLSLLLGGTVWFWYQLQEDVRLMSGATATRLDMQVAPILVLFTGTIVSGLIVVLVLALAKARDIAAASRELAVIVQFSDDAIIGETPSGIITSWNPAAERLFGYTAREAIGRTLAIVTPDNLQMEEPKILARVARNEHIEHFETTRRTKDGRQLAVAATISPITDSNGKVTGVSRVVRDISERRRFIDALERSNRELQRFAYVASHDLQTPLRSIVSFTELLQKSLAGKLTDDEENWLRRVVTSGERMQVLLQDLLTYARVEGRGNAFEPVDLNRTFDTAKELLFAALQESGAQITRGELPTVAGDATQLLQLMQNLIGNAIKYRSQQAPIVDVRATIRGGQYVVSVSDNGIGIDPKHNERIFDVFQRLHTNQAYPGTGIGLAVCRRIVERHHGSIWVKSEPGRGSTFYFSLPVERPQS